MGLTSFREIRTIFRNFCNLQFRFPLLCFVALTGCNTCFTFTSNPPTGTLGIVTSDPRPACTLQKMNAAVRPQLAVAPVCSSCVGSGQVQHIFLSIRGIDINSSATAHDDSLDWQELLPADFVQKPLQVDLMDAKADQGVPIHLAEFTSVPAGVYRQLRLRFVPNQPGVEDRLPENNMCGGGTLNCIVTADGNIQPLQLGDGSPELRISPDSIKGASLLLLPDTEADVLIELKLVWELSSSTDTGVRLRPALAASAKVAGSN
jgi:hypothetical protein